MLVESLGLSYRIATRMTSWVAIDSQRSVDPRDPTRHVEQPQALPYGMSVEGLGLRGAASYPMQAQGYGMAGAAPAAPRAMAPMRELERAKLDEAEDDAFEEQTRASSVAAPKRKGFIERVRGA